MYMYKVELAVSVSKIRMMNDFRNGVIVIRTSAKAASQNTSSLFIARRSFMKLYEHRISRSYELKIVAEGHQFAAAGAEDYEDCRRQVKNFGFVTARSLPPRKDSFVSVTYGRLIETKETEDMCKRLGMTRDDVRTLRRKFDEEDGSHSHTVTIRGFFHLINDDKSFEKAHKLTKELLRLADIESSVARISFDHFLRIACTFAAFSEVQLWSFYYEAFFAGGMGSVSTKRLCAILQVAGGSYAHNIGVAARNITTSALTPMSPFHTFDDFLEFVRRNPVVFFPLVQVQHSVRNRTLGAKYWERKVREQQLIPPLLTHIRLHHGKLPSLGFSNLVLIALLRGDTVIAH